MGSSLFHLEGVELGGESVSTSLDAEGPHLALSLLRFSQEDCAQW